MNADDERMIFFSNEIISLSLFNYCLNCTINYIDASGKLAITIFLSATAAALLLNALAVLLIACVAISLLSDPGFQRALADAMVALGNGIKKLSNSVVKAIDCALDKAKKKKRDNRYEKHHIVAKGSSNKHADMSRTLLKNVKIGVNDSVNLVRIKYNLHRHLHTNEYYKSVYCFLKPAAGSYKKIVTVLNVIRAALTAASNICP